MYEMPWHCEDTTPHGRHAFDGDDYCAGYTPSAEHAAPDRCDGATHSHAFVLGALACICGAIGASRWV